MQVASDSKWKKDSLPTRCASYSFCRRRAAASLSRARAFITAQPGRNVRPAHCGPRPNPRQQEIQTPFPTDTGRATRPTFSPKAGQLQTSLFVIITEGWARSGEARGKTAMGGCVRVRGGESAAPDQSHAGNRRERGLHAARVSGAPGPSAAAPAPPVQSPGDGSPGSCASLTHPGHRRLLLLADLVEELHVLDHGVCWAVHHVVSAAKHCRSPGGVAAEKTL